MKQHNLTIFPITKEDDICYSGYFINKTVDELNNWLSKEFSKSGDIKSLKRKRSVQQNLEHFKKYFESLLPETKNSFHFFLVNDFSLFLPLEKEQLILIDKYHKREDFLFDCDNLRREYWEDFYFNENFVSCYEVDDRDRFQHYYFTETKLEERDRIKSENFKEYLAKFPAAFFLKNDKSKILGGYGPLVGEEEGRSKLERLWGSYREVEVEKMVRKLEREWLEMERNPDKYIFGNDIVKGIQNYEVKEIYCFEEFKTKLMSKMPHELFNFKWNIFPKGRKEDVIKKLEDYRGIIAVKYY